MSKTRKNKTPLIGSEINASGEHMFDNTNKIQYYAMMEKQIKHTYSYKNKKYKKLFTREYMIAFFKVYFGSCCPACKKIKKVNHWLCLNCSEKIIGSREAFEGAPKCDAHIVAIQKMIAKAQEK